MAVVEGVPVTFVDVIDMVAVLDRLMSAIGAVLVRVGFVDDVAIERALVPVVPVGPVGMRVVQVVHMVTVLDGDVATSRTVLMRMIRVRFARCCHEL